MEGDAAEVRGVRDGMAEVEEVAGGGGVDKDLTGVPLEPGRGREVGVVAGVPRRQLRPGKKKGRRGRVDQGGQGDETDVGGGWKRDSPGALHLPGRPGRGEAGPGRLWNGCGYRGGGGDRRRGRKGLLIGPVRIKG